MVDADNEVEAEPKVRDMPSRWDAVPDEIDLAYLNSSRMHESGGGDVDSERVGFKVGGDDHHSGPRWPPKSSRREAPVGALKGRR